MIVGSGEFQYRVNADWAKLPDNWSFREVGEVGPAAVSRDIPQLGPRVSSVDHTGKLIGRFGETPAGTELRKFLTPARAGRQLEGRCVCRRGFVDRAAEDRSGYAAAGPHPLLAEIREGRIGTGGLLGRRMRTRRHKRG